jgi:hypothetical protein
MKFVSKKTQLLINRKLHPRVTKLLNLLGYSHINVWYVTVPEYRPFIAGMCLGPEVATLVLHPKLIKSSDKWLTNVITHELGHYLAGHKVGPKTLEEVIKFEAEANMHALPLFSKLYPIEDFWHNDKDLGRMENSTKYYNGGL